jgi:hypothetical protein
MTQLLIKNGVGTPENRTLFKQARTTLDETQQQNLATALGLQLVGTTDTCPIAAPVLHTYKVLVQVPVIVEATSEEEARANWFDEANADSFEREDVSVVSVTRVTSEEVPLIDASEDEYDEEIDNDEYN